MNKLKYLFIALLTITVLVSCKNEKTKRAKIEYNDNLIRPEMTLRSQDTTQVRRLAMQFFDRLQQKDLNGAIAMLNYYEHDSIKPLPRTLEAKERMVYGMFLGMKYDIDHVIFFRENDSELKFTVTMFEKTDPKDKRPNKASFLIRPVRNGGKWYLTLADTMTDQVESKIKH